MLTTRLPSSTLQHFAIFSRLFIFMTRRDAPRSRGSMVAHVRGFTMRLDPTDFVDAALLFFPQLYDYRELAFLRQALSPGAVFLDIGAQLGLYALVASRAVGENGAVIAIEADPTTYHRLCHTLRANAANNVRALNVGVSDQEGLLRFGLAAPPLRSASSFLRAGDATIEVESKTLPTILREQNVTRVDGVKLDIEGYEYRVLHRFLEEAAPALWPRFIITEFHADMLSQAGGNTLELLIRHGYRVSATVDVNSILVRDAP